jgi:hypothetical protein
MGLGSGDELVVEKDGGFGGGHGGSFEDVGGAVILFVLWSSDGKIG